MLKRFGLAILFALAIVCVFPAIAWSEPQASSDSLNNLTNTVVFKPSPDAPDPNQIFKLVNIARNTAGVPPLRANKDLATIAQTRAADMVQRQYYAHKSPDGAYYYDLFPGYGLDPDYSCENLDLVFVPDSQSVLPEWLGSIKGHRECVLNSSLVEAGYATAKLTLIDFNGNASSAYVVVAIHSTVL